MSNNEQIKDALRDLVLEAKNTPPPRQRGKRDYVIKEAFQLPIKNRQGETVHAVRAEKAKNLILFSSEAMLAYRRYRESVRDGGFQVLTEDDKTLLNLALDQVGIARALPVG